MRIPLTTRGALALQRHLVGELEPGYARFEYAFRVNRSGCVKCLFVRATKPVGWMVCILVGCGFLLRLLRLFNLSKVCLGGYSRRPVFLDRRTGLIANPLRRFP